MKTKHKIFQSISTQTFLEKYWQKQPLLVRSAMPEMCSLLDPDALAGLACEPDFESRLILYDPLTNNWELRHGPFQAKDFNQLPATDWTLLVQDVDKFIADISGFLDFFSFIPTWQLDDIMVSYARRGGSVGAHVDNYDVFLIQTRGRRKWQIEDQITDDEDFRDDCQLRILKSFTPNQTWELTPGDILYLPPRFAHHGIALDDECMTFSVGFRAPDKRDLTASFFSEQVNELAENAVFSPPTCRPPGHPGEISGDTILELRNFLNEFSNDPERVAQWFGRYITQPKFFSEALDEPQLSPEKWLERLVKAKNIRRAENCRMNYFAGECGVYLFVNGEQFNLPKELLPTVSALCDFRQIDKQTILQHAKQVDFLHLAVNLTNRGNFYFE